ncbi:16S rRNA (adenine(1518)-N(6)/adenine(1519)-N(6))-dimethyltransferase RsmA [Rubeoparvulum massiliense]|uniref:16S rRNA (adenine(1518)-N(6)/adenine(1519)-N(6))- dimethyltransferase RsmA n=1 Tax=Rubeoparvulum massiliense TaxID=1631346 RepID=UPI00065DE307|nr:16S rRNA (adenine(1518)-N(6)/adenine(1519)-N(6))-dimethyltransferase RsmA [Rubeoparvulum massiliense]
MKEIATKSRTKVLLEKYGFSFKKSLGQNFLIDPNTLNRIAESADLTPQSGVLEIGPGIGALTEQLAKRAGKVVAIEIDQRLLPILRESLQEYKNVEVIHGDVLAVELAPILAQHFADCSDIHVVANLPYYITTPILMKLLEETNQQFTSIVVMMQKEVAERLAAAPGSKAYGSLSIACQYYADVEKLFTVSRKVFVPAPNVDSIVIRLKLLPEPRVQVCDHELFQKVIRAAFTQRRKMISNNLSMNLFAKDGKVWTQRLGSELDLDMKRRAETFSITEFAEMTNWLLETEAPIK